ncbi:DUF2972 domain-containing protein, partial [Campylobacter lari]|nr:DUF2972 domain-containing protein [Campylobacter lari]MCV3478575.1 DUF2972 domain-containing protein [Campylobacter lari]
IRIWGCGNHSFAKMVSYYIDTNEFHFDFYYIYLNFYKKSKISQRKLMLHFVFFGNKNKNKFIKLIAKKVPILMITRDPISILKTWANHTGKNDAEKKEVHLNLDSNYGDFLKIKYLNYENYLFDGVDNPDIRNIKSAQKSFLYRDIVSSMEHSILYVKYVDIQEITVDNIHNILNSLLGFSFFKKNQKIQETINDMTIYLTRNRKLIYKNEIEIYITNNFNFRGLNNITHFLLNKNINNIIFAVDDCNLKKIIKSDSVENIREVIYDFLLKFNKAVCNEKEKHIKEQDILEYLLSNSSERRFYWDKINYDLVYLKKYRPDIIASWKYYQEFEKMCKELDGD